MIRREWVMRAVDIFGWILIWAAASSLLGWWTLPLAAGAGIVASDWKVAR